MRKAIFRLKEILDRVLDGFAVVLFVVIFTVVLLQVFMRYVLGSPLVWSEELARYLFVWVSFIGWVFATRSGSHIRIGAIFDLLPALARRVIGAGNTILVFVFAASLGLLGFQMALKTLDVPTVTLFFPYALVYFIVPVSCVFIAFYAAVALVTGRDEKGGTAL
jgi:TRAP-type C4-dicarboxylate transport system permease small subunit